MDLAKLIDKFFGFLSGLVPGSVVLLIAALHRPEAWSAFWKVSYLVYQTKITILFVLALIAGSTVNSVLTAVIWGISGGVADRQAEKREQLKAQAMQKAQAAAQAEQQHHPSAGPPPQPSDDPASPVAPVAALPQEVAYWRDVNWCNMSLHTWGRRPLRTCNRSTTKPSLTTRWPLPIVCGSRNRDASWPTLPDAPARHNYK